VKTSVQFPSLLLFAVAIMLVGAKDAHGRRAYGVSGNRGTAVATPRGVAWSGENSSGAVTRRGGAVTTDNGAAVAGQRGVAVAGENGSVVAGRRGVAVAGNSGAAVAGAVYPRPLPAGYVRYVPNGSRAVVYGGYSCFFVGGVYYRPVFYGGETVYVVVK
jgi:hypothetical protein